MEPVCGVIYDPLAEENIEICEACKQGECKENLQAPLENNRVHSFHLGACGLILDYML
ncbi:hypothetical protein [Paenibacillus sp. GP183]|jgi:hypothetical protein|uniref:hypothetical protein n=1 Tax=Paenibacillus sp. GP183 TaxID=1882751 RepID=UPI00089A03BF|nr:hypothetical protein [Paenibacillus sp. GP183]SEB48528.1 hypothetical protein SAMN05443246_0623 [Paenibacillus sp. GP183]